MERGTLIQHLEAVVICEESSTNVNGNMVILDIYPMMKGEKKKKVSPFTIWVPKKGKRGLKDFFKLFFTNNIYMKQT
jgi:hypothetical protein